MSHPFLRPLKTFCILVCVLAPVILRAEVPPLLAEAIRRWSAGQGDLAFTQETKTFLANGQVKDERIERYDPSLPDNRRWRLIEINGQPATQEQRQKWEAHKNGKPRRKVDESPSEFLNLEHATLVGETTKDARFRIPLRPEPKRLVDLEDIDVVVTVDKQTGNVRAVGAALKEPLKVFFGIARITNLRVDFRIVPDEEGPANASDEVGSGSTAEVKISRLGKPVEYNWSDFKRVTTFAGP